VLVPKDRNNITVHEVTHWTVFSASVTQEYLANNTQNIIKSVQVDDSKTSALMKISGIVDCSRLILLLKRSKIHPVFFYMLQADHSAFSYISSNRRWQSRNQKPLQTNRLVESVSVALPLKAMCRLPYRMQ